MPAFKNVLTALPTFKMYKKNTVCNKRCDNFTKLLEDGIFQMEMYSLTFVVNIIFYLFAHYK